MSNNNSSCLCYICNRPVTHPLETLRHIECGSLFNKIEEAKRTIITYKKLITDMEENRRLQFADLAPPCEPFCACALAINIAMKKIDRANEIIDSMEFAIFLRKTHPVPQWPQ